MKEIIQEVVQKKYELFYNYALKLTAYEVEEAQDLVQEAILHALTSINNSKVIRMIVRDGL